MQNEPRPWRTKHDMPWRTEHDMQDAGCGERGGGGGEGGFSPCSTANVYARCLRLPASPQVADDSGRAVFL